MFNIADMEGKDILIEIQYFPCIAVFVLASGSKSILLEAKENYQKGSYRNRCVIAGANGLLQLSVPLRSGKSSQKPIQKVEIAYAEPWISKHLHAIRSAYGSSPYFHYYYDSIEEILKEKHKYLFTLNKALLTFLINACGISIPLNETTVYQKVYPSVLDLRNIFTPREMDNIPSSVNLNAYPQVFRPTTTFVANLSLLDLLFNMGPESSIYLEKCLLSE